MEIIENVQLKQIAENTENLRKDRKSGLNLSLW